MVRAWLLVAVVLALTAPASPAQAASSMHVHLEDEGTFEAGLRGAGKALFPSFVDAPDHERLPLPVNPCHRQLSLGLEYEPRNASVRAAESGYAAEATMPYRFQAGLIAPDGTVLHRIVVEEPDLSIPFGTVDESGPYTLELELLEGAAVEWEVRVRGFAVHEDPTCDVWLNEVETHASNGGDWVELYNEGEETVDLSGWALEANRTAAEHVLADGFALSPGEHRVVDVERGAFGPAEETVTLLGPRGSPFSSTPPLDDLAPDERTWQKADDGLGDWIFAEGTPGQPNAG